VNRSIQGLHLRDACGDVGHCGCRQRSGLYALRWLTLAALLVLLSATDIQAQYQIIPVNNDHFVVEWEIEPRTRITFGDSATEVKVLDRERYLIRTRRSEGWILLSERGEVLRKTLFTDPHQLWPMRHLFTAYAGWNEGGEKLYEIWDRDGKKLIDQVFHAVEVDHPFQARIVCRRGNMAYVLDTTGTIREKRTLYRIGDPSPENGFLGRWKWRRSLSHDYAMNAVFDGDSIITTEPEWSVNHRKDSAVSPIEGRLSIEVDQTTSLLFADVIKGAAVTIRNTSKDPVRLDAFAGLVGISYEVLNEENSWVRVNYDRHGYCGNSGGYKDLAAGYSAVIVIPVFTGTTPTRFRCRITYRDLSGRSAEVISDEWEGTFNFGDSEWPWLGGRYGELLQYVD